MRYSIIFFCALAGAMEKESTAPIKQNTTQMPPFICQDVLQQEGIILLQDNSCKILQDTISLLSEKHNQKIKLGNPLIDQYLEDCRSEVKSLLKEAKKLPKEADVLDQETKKLKIQQHVINFAKAINYVIRVETKMLQEFNTNKHTNNCSE